MFKIVLFSLAILLTQPSLAQDCTISNLEGRALAVVKTNGAMGVYDNSGGLMFAGITHRDVISGREAEIFSRPWILQRGSTQYCTMSSYGWSEADGVIYDFSGTYVGYLSEDGKIFNRNNEQVGTYNDVCASLPTSLRFRLVSGVALIMLLKSSVPAISSYYIGYNPETCSLGYHPGMVRARVLVEPIPCQNCGYTITPIGP